ncbi:CTP synthetase [Lentibacter algarum]|uniref:CTP synthetase n=1 Tax=Lentibacter algarum TaxID=576131 RepID=UPI001C076FFF|nr:CTP synthetase [Lentibacter algarum]MBU2981383.1 CTP synthetase [Lentibacter algarum]
MLRMALIFHLFIGSTLAGIGVIAALVSGYDTLVPILIAALIGFVVSFPVTWLVAKAVYENG